jgi:hypothetical protein
MVSFCILLLTGLPEGGKPRKRQTDALVIKLVNLQISRSQGKVLMSTEKCNYFPFKHYMKQFICISKLLLLSPYGVLIKSTVLASCSESFRFKIQPTPILTIDKIKTMNVGNTTPLPQL